MIVNARTIRFKKVIPIIRKRSAIFLHLNRYLYNGVRRDYCVFHYFNNSSYLNVILRVNVNISAKAKNVTDDQKSINEINYHLFYTDNIDADQYLYLKIIDDMNFDNNFD